MPWHLWMVRAQASLSGSCGGRVRPGGRVHTPGVCVCVTAGGAERGTTSSSGDRPQISVSPSLLNRLCMGMHANARMRLSLPQAHTGRSACTYACRAHLRLRMYARPPSTPHTCMRLHSPTRGILLVKPAGSTSCKRTGARAGQGRKVNGTGTVSLPAPRTRAHVRAVLTRRQRPIAVPSSAPPAGVLDTNML